MNIWLDIGEIRDGHLNIQGSCGSSVIRIGG